MKTALITGYTELNPLIPAMKNTYSWKQVIMGRKRIDREVVEKQCELCRSAFEVQIGTRSEFKRFCTGACAKKFNGQSNKGRKHTEASKHKISLSLTGERNPFYGKKHSQESKIKIGETHTVEEFLHEVFWVAGLDVQKHLVIDERLRRPHEVPWLEGDMSKARRVLGWEPKTKFKELARLMFQSDLKNLQDKK